MAQLNISLPPEDLKYIRGQAKERGLPISRYVREQLCGALSGTFPPPSFTTDAPTRGEFDTLSERVSEIERVAQQTGAM